MTRKEYVQKGFENAFSNKSELVIECGGRNEILGNHTDHNHGLCLVSSCDLTIVCAIRARKDGLVSVVSEGNKPFAFYASDLEKIEEEKFTSIALTKGVMAYFEKHGFKVGGFEAYMTSTIFSGAGVSSSAAYEVLIGKIISVLYNEDKADALFLAKAGQFAENDYFGKSCGLLDQIGVAFGAINFIDFNSTIDPIVTPLPILKEVDLVLTNPGESHAALSHLYSAIPADMYKIANFFGKKYLREVSDEELETYPNKDELAYTRAVHYRNENKRVAQAMKALKENDTKAFLEMVKGSQESSKSFLKNTMHDHYEGSPQAAIDYANAFSDDYGATRIHGGGFAGTILSFVYKDKTKDFVKYMAKKFGEENVHVVTIRDKGAAVI